MTDISEALTRQIKKQLFMEEVSEVINLYRPEWRDEIFEKEINPHLPENYTMEDYLQVIEGRGIQIFNIIRAKLSLPPLENPDGFAESLVEVHSEILINMMREKAAPHMTPEDIEILTVTMRACHKLCRTLEDCGYYWRNEYVSLPIPDEIKKQKWGFAECLRMLNFLRGKIGAKLLSPDLKRAEYPDAVKSTEKLFIQFASKGKEK